MKLFNYLIVLLVSLAILSCGKDDPDPVPEPYQPNFINQNLSGKINGESWNFKFGSGKNDFSNDDRIRFSFHDAESDEDTDTCNIFQDGNQVMNTLPKEVGLYNLSLSRTVTLYVKSTTMNYIVTQGAVEITSIDLEENKIYGRMDAKYNDQNFVNGNFVLKYCEGTMF